MSRSGRREEREQLVTVGEVGAAIDSDLLDKASEHRASLQRFGLEWNEETYDECLHAGDRPPGGFG